MSPAPSHPADRSSAATVTAPLPSRAADPDRGRPAPAPWVWMLLACTLLGASGGVRVWQDRYFGLALNQGDVPPFPLRELPQRLGAWEIEAGGEGKLDPEVARIAGCSDHIIRTYINRATGVSVTTLVLFGRAQAVAFHTPEVCYASAGYVPVEEALRRTVETGRGPAAFRSGVFARGEGASNVRQEVYYSFRHNDLWTPDAASSWKRFRRSPAMFKVQVQRQVAEHEHREVDNPTEQFLALLVPELERRIGLNRGETEGQEDGRRPHAQP
jgi:uncharacterized protein DUF3485